MTYRAIFFASLLTLLAIHPESIMMLSAAEKNAKQPGPTDKDAETEFTTTESGLKYRILRKSSGDKPWPNDNVTVNYKGWLDNGTEFDSSYKRGKSIDFNASQVIPGWTEGLQLLGKGGMIELEIPSDIGYGTRGAPPDIPPNATLHFIVELIELKRGQKPAEQGPTDPDAPSEFTTTASGLKYRILRKSAGDKPLRNDKVTFHIRGWLDTKKEFKSSYKEGKPLTITPSGVCPGWNEGLQLIGKGGMIELEIPSEIGFGKDGIPGLIPGNSTLHLVLELLDLKRGPEPVEPGVTDADAPEEFTSTPSGLKYRIRRASNGKKPTASNEVAVHYKGWLDGGEVFDSSYENGVAAKFRLNQVVKGWTEGLQLIGTGGMIELEIPYKLGYGERGSPPKIPPKATLHFLVELLEVK